MHPPGRLQVQGLPQAVYRHGRHRHGAVAYPAVQVGSRGSTDGVQQEGHVRASTASHARHDLRDRVVPVSSASRGRDRSRTPGPIGGANKVVEADETYVGGKAQATKPSVRRRRRWRVFTLVERDGEARSLHVANVNGEDAAPDHGEAREPQVVSDDRRSACLPKSRRRVRRAWHRQPQRRRIRAARAASCTPTRSRAFFALLKRGVYGTFHNISEAHLHRYLAEFDFRYNNRELSKTNDARRALLRGAKGKRLMYRQPDQASNA